MAKKTQTPPKGGASQLQGFIFGVLVAGVVIAAVLFFLRSREPETTAAAPAAPPPVQQQPMQQGPPPAPMFPPDAMAAAPRIGVDEAKAMMDRGEAVFIDVRDINSFQAGHIPGALQIPLDYVQGEIPWFPGDRMLIPYCT